MSRDNVTAKCGHCATPCDPNDSNSCKKCGKIEKCKLAVLNEILYLNEKVKGSKTSEYYEKHPKIIGALIVLWLGSLVLGYFQSGAFGSFYGGINWGFIIYTSSLYYQSKKYRKLLLITKTPKSFLHEV